MGRLSLNQHSKCTGLLCNPAIFHKLHRSGNKKSAALCFSRNHYFQRFSLQIFDKKLFAKYLESFSGPPKAPLFSLNAWIFPTFGSALSQQAIWKTNCSQAMEAKGGRTWKRSSSLLAAKARRLHQAHKAHWPVFVPQHHRPPASRSKTYFFRCVNYDVAGMINHYANT